MRDVLTNTSTLACSWVFSDDQRYLDGNDLATLPEGAFQGLTALETL